MALHHKSWSLLRHSFKPLVRAGQRNHRILAELVLEVVLIVFFLKVYNVVRNQFGSQKSSPQQALDHALDIVRIEQMLGMFWEQKVQASAS
jgi:hypothetical protein